MHSEIKVATVGDALKFLITEWELVFHISGVASVVGKLIRVMLAKPELLIADAEVPIPLHPCLAPVVKPLLLLTLMNEELHLHLFKLARPEGEVPWCHLVTESLATLRDSKRHLHTGRHLHIAKVDEDRLRGLRSQIGNRLGVFRRPDISFEHEAKLARRVEPTIAIGAFRGHLVYAQFMPQVVDAVTSLALTAVDHHVVEVANVTRRFPHFRLHYD